MREDGLIKVFAIGIFCLLVLTVAWRHSRNLLHPVFTFTLAWIGSGVLAGGFMIERIETYSWETILAGLALLSTNSAICLFSRALPIRINQERLERTIDFDSAIHIAILLFATLIFGEFLRQFSLSGFSIGRWFQYSTGPRFGRPWSVGRLGGSEFFVRLFLTLVSVAGAGVSFLLPFVRKNMFPVALAAFLLSLTLSFFSGSRTAFIMNVGSLFLASTLRYGFGVNVRSLLLVTMLVGCIPVANFTVQSRSIGMNRNTDQFFENLSLIPKTDDNFPRLLHAIERDSANDKHLDLPSFFMTSFFGFVPRYFWPSKPTLEQDYYRKWKPYYTTITSSGDFVAVLGLPIAFAANLLFGGAIFWMLRTLYCRCNNILDVSLYVYGCFFSYMMFRTAQNFSFFIIPFIAMYAYIWFSDRMGSRRANSLFGYQ